MALIDINWNPNQVEIRSFGKTVLIGFSIIGSIIALTTSAYTTSFVLAGIGVFLAIFSYTFPKLSILPYRLWMSIAFVMGNVMSRLLLALIYFGIITPIALLARMVGRDRLRLKKNSSTQWRELSRDFSRGTYLRQY